jgi:hypothetical protein
MARKTIIITPKDRDEEMLLQQLIKRMGLHGRTLTDEELEDAGLALVMSKVDRSKVADCARVMRKLRA